MPPKCKPFYFNGIYVTDPLHYQMLKELYSSELNTKSHDDGFQQYRIIFASIIITLEKPDSELLNDRYLAALAQKSVLGKIIPLHLISAGRIENHLLNKDKQIIRSST